MSIIQAAAEILADMATFADAGVVGDPAAADADLARSR
jgi:hypothetical protein